MTTTKKLVDHDVAGENKIDGKDSAEDNKEMVESPNATHENETVDKPRRRERSPIVKERCIKGIVKWFSVRKGYGFIHVDDDIDDIFVHHSAIVRQTRQPITLIENQEVEFDIVKGIKGLEACCVSGPNGYRVGTSVPSFPYGRGHIGYRRNDGYHPVQQVDNGGKRVVKAVNNAAAEQEKGSGNDKPNKKRGNFRQRNRGHQRPRKNSDEQHDKAGTEKPQTTDDDEDTEKENIEVKKE